MDQKGAITLVVPLLLLIIIAAVIFVLFSQGLFKNPLSKIPILPQSKESTVSLQKQYQNPFDKSVQYVNPFSEFKNPFDLIKK